MKNEIFVTLIPTGNLEALKRVDSKWANWLVDNLYPISPKLKLTDLPFYTYSSYLKHKKIYDKILNKKFLFSGMESMLDILEEDEIDFPTTVYKIPNTKLYTFYHESNGVFKGDVPLSRRDTNRISQKLPVGYFVRGFVIGKTFKVLYYLNEDEYRKGECEDRLNARTLYTKQLLGDRLEYVIGLGVHQKEQLESGTYLHGSIFDLKVEEIINE